MSKRELQDLRLIAEACSAHTPYIPLAEEIQHRVTTEAAHQAGNLDVYMDSVIRSVESGVRARLLMEQLALLPAEQRDAIISNHLGGSAARDLFAEAANKIAQYGEDDRQLRHLRHDYARYGSLDLRRIPVGMTLGLYLHDTDDFIEPEGPRQLNQACTTDRYIYAAAAGEGAFKILQDEIGSADVLEGYAMKPALPPYETVQLGDLAASQTVFFGGGIAARSGERFDPLRLARIDTDDESYSISLAIARIDINNERLPSMPPTE